MITLKDVHFRYKNAQGEALRGIDLHIPKGEMVFIMGPSGAGKSTLCATFNGLIPHLIKGDLLGDVLVTGRQTREFQVKDFAPLVGLVFQDFEAQLFSTTVELEVAFGPENLGLERDRLKERVAQTLELVGLEGLRKRQPATLSGGEKQRLALASVLAMEPEVLVLDEPTTDLDPLGKREFLTATRELKKRRGVTLVMVEHETEEALKADRVILMGEGRVLAQGSPLEVLSDGKALEELGVRPIQMAELSGALGLSEVWTSPDEAYQGLLKRGWSLSPMAYQRLLEGDRGRNYGEVIIEAQGLTYWYEGGIPALQGVDITIRQGEFLAIVGQNGSGKTTLVKHLNGLLRPKKGDIFIGGRNILGEKPTHLSRKVGLVFQNPDHQIFSERVWDEVAFGPKLQGLSPGEVSRRVDQALEAVGLEEYRNDDPFILTKGGRQRLAVAGVLATQPEVIILDEPTTGLDQKELRSMMELVEGLNRAGHTIIMVTHSMPLVAEYASRVVVMKGGRIIRDGPTRTVFSDKEALEGASLIVPPVVTLSSRLGYTTLSVKEFLDCLVKGPSH